MAIVLIVPPYIPLFSGVHTLLPAIAGQTHRLMQHTVSATIKKILFFMEILLCLRFYLEVSLNLDSEQSFSSLRCLYAEKEFFLCGDEFCLSDFGRWQLFFSQLPLIC